MPNNWLNNRKRRPTHPGEILREDVLPAAGLTQDKLARLLGVSRRTVSEILHERRPVTTDMARRRVNRYANMVDEVKLFVDRYLGPYATPAAGLISLIALAA